MLQSDDLGMNFRCAGRGGELASFLAFFRLNSCDFIKDRCDEAWHKRGIGHTPTGVTKGG
jgi:hypothetical protein